jgi:hypothetical protein
MEGRSDMGRKMSASAEAAALEVTKGDSREHMHMCAYAHSRCIERESLETKEAMRNGGTNHKFLFSSFTFTRLFLLLLLLLLL